MIEIILFWITEWIQSNLLGSWKVYASIPPAVYIPIGSYLFFFAVSFGYFTAHWELDLQREGENPITGKELLGIAVFCAVFCPLLFFLVIEMSLSSFLWKKIPKISP